jgi:putative ABC transport system permease protein
LIDSIVRDARLAFLALTRTPGFTTAAVLTLGIGMGGTVLMLTAANAAFREPLAFGNADRLVHIWQVSPRANQVAVPLMVARDWEAASKSLDSIGLALGAGSVSISNGADADRAVRGLVSRNFFATLGVTPILGRTFSTDEAATRDSNRRRAAPGGGRAACRILLSGRFGSVDDVRTER